MTAINCIVREATASQSDQSSGPESQCKQFSGIVEESFGGLSCQQICQNLRDLYEFDDSYWRVRRFVNRLRDDKKVPSKEPQTYVRSTRERLNVCWKRLANARGISIDCNWKNSNNRLKQYSGRNCTAELPKSQKRVSFRPTASCGVL